MPTLWEQMKAKEAEEARTAQTVRATTGAITELGVGYVRGGATPATILATTIDVISGLGIAAWNFLRQRKEIKEKQALTAQQTKVQTGVDSILTTIEETGLSIIEQHGLDPLTSTFETAMRDNLYKVIGYKGNCNANVWQIGSKPGPNRPVWFRVSQGGRKLEGTPLLVSPPKSLQTHWYVRCKNARDTWINTYRDLLIQQGRLQELEAFEAARKKGDKIIKIVFSLLITILLVVAMRYGLKIK